MSLTHAYAAQSANTPLAPFTFERRGQPLPRGAREFTKTGAW
ncbi:hypothetical protein [Variovorax sp. dw_308]|nr:hypothetical protein [Variovorax sp. dw_308]